MKTYNITIDSYNETPVYDVIQYPGGEIQTRLNKNAEYFLEKLRNRESQDWFEFVITARIRETKDFMILAQMCDIIRNLCLHKDAISLRLPYLPYARADRRFVGETDTHGLGVFASLLGCIMWKNNIYKVNTIDVHPKEEVLEEITNTCGYSFDLFNDTPEPHIVDAIKRTLIFSDAMFCHTMEKNQINILLPDKGAKARYEGVIQDIVEKYFTSNVGVIKCNVVNCEKERDAATGVLLGFKVPGPEKFNGGPILLVDDICDGGWTFIGIGQALDKAGVHNRRFLYVTHGIFSQGLEKLLEEYEEIYTTNSYYNPKSKMPGSNRVKPV